MPEKITQNAAAIVVGIDAYKGVPGLTGCVQDALDVTGWLIEVGVPPERISLHIAPTKDVETPEHVVRAGATRDEIWASIAQLSETKAKGDRLFVFLSGHGYFLASSGPIFLCADYSKTFRSKNLDIRRYADFFQGLGFTDTLFVVDACQNYDVDPSFRSAIEPSGPDDQTVLPKPKNGLMLCCAAEQEQYAPVIDGRGLLTRVLLDALKGIQNTRRAAGDALMFDWATGSAEVDLAPLFQFAVAPDVTALAKAAKHKQNPTMQPLGRLSREWRFITHSIPDLAVEELNVTARDLAGLDCITVRTSPPVRALDLPLPSDPPLPFKGFAPAGRRLDADCIAAVDWDADPPTRVVAKVDGPITMHFDLRKSGPPPGGERVVSAPIAEINVKMLDAAGIPAAGVNVSDYEVVERAIGGIAFKPSEAWQGIPSFTHNETGPDLALNGTPLEHGLLKARNVAEVLTAVVSERHPGASFVVIPPGQAWENATLPNLRIDLPDGGMSAVAGRLFEAPLIRLERLGRVGPDAVVKVFSAEDVAAQPWQRVDPGGYRLVVAAPWGEGVETVVVGGGRARVLVPIPEGDAPLRNRLTEEEIGDILSRRPAFFVPGDGAVSLDADRLNLSYLPTWPGGSLLAAEDPAGVRIEPFSDLAWPEWDQLLVAGRLEGLDLRALRAKMIGVRVGQPDVELLRLALGYAAWGQNDRQALEEVVRLLGAPLDRTTDYKLLALLLAERTTDEFLDPPLLRWGAGLAQLVAPNTALPGPTSARSAWALYEQDESRVVEDLYALA